MEELKVVGVNNDEFKNVEVFFDNIGVFGPTRLGSEEKTRTQELSTRFLAGASQKT